MKKLFIFFALFTLPLFLTAEDWPFVCEKSELPQFGKSDIAGGFSNSTAFIIHAGTAKIDRKNKTIKVWETHISDSAGRDRNVNDFGGSYENYGYTKSLAVYDLQNDRVKYITSTYYECGGSVIESFTPAKSSWSDIIPGSLGDGNLRALKQKFKF